MIDVREMLTSQQNIHITVVATGTNHLARVTNTLSELGFDIISSESTANHYVKPWREFDFTSPD